MTTLEMVKEFHEKFLHPINDRPYEWNNPSEDQVSLEEFRVSLLQEELDELKKALLRVDIAETLDALCDLQVVLDGTFLALGFWRVKQEAMEEVHRSNMSKLGADGKPIHREDGKILKGPNYTRPNLHPIVEKLYETSNPS